MSEQEEDFAAMFEASTKARQFDRGQTIEGTSSRSGRRSRSSTSAARARPRSTSRS